MTTLKLSPNASGAGSFTIAAPSTSSDFTLNLPSTLGTNNGSALVSTDASGNLGLGVTPPTGAGNYRAFNAGAALMYGNTGVAVAAYNSNADINDKYIISGFASSYVQSSGKHTWYTAPSGTAGNAISFTQAMTLDASGNLGVGTTSPATDARLNVVGGYARVENTVNTTISGSYVWNSTDRGMILFNRSNTANTAVGLTMFGGTSANSVGAIYMVQEVANSAGALAFYTGGDSKGSPYAYERARIDSSGNVMIAKTALNVAVAGIELRANGDSYFSRTDSTNSQSTLGVYSTGAGAYRFYVGMGGTVYATSTTISAISDIRFKENVRDLDAGLAEVMALKPRLYDWKEGKGANTKNARGFIAQEFEQVFPDLIDEWKDPAPEGEEPYKSVRQDLIPVLVKAIQEQQTLIQDQLAIINTQQTELEQLKAQLTSVSADVAALKGAK